MNSQAGGMKLSMGACVDCGKEWHMTGSEKEHWDELKRTKGYNMPKRCPPCRKKKKERKDIEKRDHKRFGLAKDIRRIAHAVQDGMYEEGDPVLPAVPALFELADRVDNLMSVVGGKNEKAEGEKS